jgi:hypothetical protein
MPIAAVLAAAESAAETSKTAFYVCGGLLAVFAVLLALFGIRRPSFPGNRSAERAVIGLAAVLVVGSMVTAVATA